MSAEERRHEGAPKNIDERVISEERLSWRGTPQSGESVALAHERAEDTDQRAETPSGAALERDETLDRLLCAIGETEIAKLMGEVMPAGPLAPGYAEPPKTLFPVDGAGAQPFAGVVQAEPAAGATRTALQIAERGQTTGEGDSYSNGPGLKLADFASVMRGFRPLPLSAESSSAAYIAQTSPVAKSMPSMSSAAPPPLHPAPAEPDNIGKDKTRYRLLRAITEAGRLEGETPASDLQFRHFVQTSPQAGSVRLMPPATAPPHPRVSAAPRMVEGANGAAVPQVPSPPQPAAVADSAPAIATPRRAAPDEDRSAITTAPASCNSEVNRPGAKLAQTTKSIGRTLWQNSARFTNRVVAEAEAILESTDFAGSRRSTGLEDGAGATQSAPDMEGGARQQRSNRLKRWLDPRRGSRVAKPPVIAYCWTADTPDPVEIADIGPGGVRLLTDARWPRGGVFSMTLKRSDRSSETPESWIVIDFMVVRLCNDGVAGAFISSTHRLSRFIPSRAENCADDKTLKHFVRQLAIA